LADVKKRTKKVEKKINMILMHHGHIVFDDDHEEEDGAHHMGYGMGHADFLNPHSNYMGGGYALPYGVMSPMMMGYGGFGYGMGMGTTGAMPMGAYNYPDKQEQDETKRQLRNRLRV
jgi:hypothetical protein